MYRRLSMACLVATVVFVLSAGAWAQDRGYSDHRGYSPAAQRNTSRQDYDRGYSQGVAQGRQDRLRGRNFNDRRGGQGNTRSAFNDGYRAGYTAGYRESAARGPNGRNEGVYNPNTRGPVYGGNGPVRGGNGQMNSQAAYQNGYNLGLPTGQQDRSSGRSFDLNRHDTYRNGDQGYSASGYNNRDLYKQQFRQGYARGYEQGYGRRN